MGSPKGGGICAICLPSPHASVVVAALQGGVLLQLSSVLAAYQARNVTTVFNNQYPVWQVGWYCQAVGRLPAPTMGQQAGDYCGTIQWTCDAVTLLAVRIAAYL